MSPREDVLARLGHVTVTTRQVECARWGSVPVGRVRRIKPSRSIVLGAAVDVIDAADVSRRYKFSTAQAARTFITALLRANDGVVVESDDDGTACFVWT